MRKRDWLFFVAIPLTLTWLSDRLSKLWAVGLQGFEFYGPVGLVLHHNHGAILGSFSNLPPVLRIVSLSTGGAFLIFVFFVLQYILPIRSSILRIGMSILLGGILGNVTDRIIWGYVVDFLVLGSPERFTPFVFNVADVLQWVGYFLIVGALIKDGKVLWPDQNMRKKYLVNPKFQLQYCIKLMGFGLGFAIIAGTYSYTFMKVSIESLIGIRPMVEERFLEPFIITFGVVSFIFIVLMFYVGVVLSQRVAGPLYAFEKFLEDMMSGKSRQLKLRAGDEFTHLEKLAERLVVALNEERVRLKASGLEEVKPLSNSNKKEDDS